MTNKPLISLLSLIQLFFPKRIKYDNLIDIWKNTNDFGFFLSKSSWSFALLSIIKSKENNNDKVKIWFPSYFCNESLFALRCTNCEISFYPVQSNLEPNYESLEKLKIKNGNPDIFVLVHYFGKQNSTTKVVNFCRSNKCWLVEDAAHVLFPNKYIGKSGDFVMYSPHKLLPIPNGAVFVTRKNGPSRISNELIKKYFDKNKWKKLLYGNKIFNNKLKKFSFKLINLIWLIKQILQNIGIKRYVKYPFNENLQSNDDYIINPEISSISLRLISNFQKQFFKISLKRKINYMFWENHFNQINLKTSNTKISSIGYENFNWVPYYFVFEGFNQKIKEIYDSLDSNKYLPSTWPDLPPEVLKNKDTYKVANEKRRSTFLIPNNQSINRKHFLRLDDNLKFNKKNEINFHVKWNDISRDKWNELIKKSEKSNLLQLWSYGFAKENVENWKANRVVFYENNQIIAIAQIMEKNIFKLFKIYRINRGPIFFTDKPEYIKRIIKYILSLSNIFKLNFVFASFELEYNPSNISLLNNSKVTTLATKGYSSIWIDLKLSTEEIRNNLNSKWRNMLVKSEKENLKIESSFSKESVYWLSNLHELSMKNKGFKGISSKMLNSIYSENDNQNKLIVYKAIKENEVIGAISIINHGKCATYLTGWTNDEGRKTNSNYLLLWTSIIDLKNSNMSSFDLGGIDLELTPNITRFKSRMNGKTYNLVPPIIKLI